jgi:WD40 repeat protein
LLRNATVDVLWLVSLACGYALPAPKISPFLQESLVSVGDDGYLAEWSVDSSGQHDVSRLGNGQGRFFSVSYWPGHNVIAVGHENGTIRCFDMAEGRTIGRAITAHDSFVQALAFSAVGSRLASSGAEGEIAIWDIGEEAWISVACAIANDVDQSVVRVLPFRGNDAYLCGRHRVITPWTEPALSAGCAAWTCSHDTGHIWEEILPHPSESMSLTLKDLERQVCTVFWAMIRPSY